MILEGLIIAGCLGPGTHNESCTAGLNGYVKHYKLDEKAQTVEHNIKKKYPGLHFSGTVIATTIHRKYAFLIYKNIWYNGDYSNLKEPVNKIIYKYEF